MNSKLKRIFDEISKTEIQGIIDSSIFSSNNGFSGEKIIGLLQRLASIFNEDETTCYLEVGIYRGLSLLSTAIGSPRLSCFGIDNFAYLDPQKNNLKNVEEIINYRGIKNATIINMDYEDALETLEKYIGNKKIAVYFIDGPHDYRSQLLCLNLILPFLNSDSVIVIDDCNYQHVRQANRDFLLINREWKLAFEAYTSCHPDNMSYDTYNSSREGWWNGINVIVRDSMNELLPTFPPTHRDRILFENEQVIHGMQLAEFTPQLIRYFQYLLHYRFFKASKLFIKFFWDYTHSRNNYRNRFEYANTYSSSLPKARHAPFREVQ